MTMLNPYNYSKPKNPMAMGKKGPASKPRAVKNNGANKSNNYLEQKVMSAKPEELTLMLYEGIIKFVKQAQLFNERKDIEKSGVANMRAQAIVQELRATLDMSIDISNNLESLYIFMSDRLIEANIKKDNAILDEVLELAEEFRDTWKQAMNL